MHLHLRNPALFQTYHPAVMNSSFIKKYLVLKSRSHSCSFRGTGVQTYDGTMKFQPSKLLSANDKIADQLKIQNCDVQWLKEMYIVEISSYRLGSYARMQVLRKERKWSRLRILT